MKIQLEFGNEAIKAEDDKKDVNGNKRPRTFLSAREMLFDYFFNLFIFNGSTFFSCEQFLFSSTGPRPLKEGTRTLISYLA